MAASIRNKTTRDKLKARREPHWHPIKKGCALGFRKMPGSGSESWMARFRDPETGKQIYSALGEAVAGFDYDEALAAAEVFFAERDAGIVGDGRFTVADACKEYVAELRSAKRTAAADDAEWRFKRGAIYGHKDDAEQTELAKLRMGSIELKKLRPPTIKKWRELLNVGNSGANRMMTTLRAALNLAVENDKVAATAAQAWRKVKQHEKADKRRDIYLDLAQRRALLDACKGGVRDLIEAALLTGARPGELASALRGAFSAKAETLKLTGKTGAREVELSPSAVVLFKRLSESKLPTARLLVQDDGKPWKSMATSRAIRAASAAATYKDENGKDAKLPRGVVLYTMRHTYISQAIFDGLTTLDVARLTGTSLQIIDQHYGKKAQGTALRERLAKVGML